MSMGWSGLGGEVLGEAISVFQPSFAHTLAERRRREFGGEEVGDGAPPLGVDLDAGIVRLTMPVQTEDRLRT